MPTDDPRSRNAPDATTPAQRVVPWVISIALHAALVVGALFIVWRIAAPPEEAPASAISFDEPSYNPTLIPDSELLDAEDAFAQREAAIEALLQPDPALSRPDTGTVGLDDIPPESLSMPPSPPGALAIERPAPLGATFAGLAAGDARDVVYVVDGSGSMLTTLPDVLDRLRASIAGLHPTQRFQVIVFQTFTDQRNAVTTFVTPPARSAGAGLGLLPASSDLKASVDAWLTRSVKPRGRSNPTDALRAALDLKPDAIFLLSSRITDREGGSFDADELLAWLETANPVDRESGRRRVLIQTVQVLDEDPEQLLERIAQTHAGAGGYNYISREELTRAKADQPTPPAHGPPDTER
jgi:hypothetical protein